MGGCQGGPGSTCSGGLPKVLLVSSGERGNSDVQAPDISARREDDEEYEKVGFTEPRRASGASQSRRGPGCCQQLTKELREQLRHLGDMLEADCVSNGCQSLLKKVERKLEEVDDEFGRTSTGTTNGTTRHSHWQELLDVEEESSSQEDTEARAFLLQTFTNFQPEIAESHHVLDAAGPKRQRGKRESMGFLMTTEALNDKSVSDLLTHAGTFDFDALKFSKNPALKKKPLRVIGTHLLENSGLFEDIILNRWVREGEGTAFANRALRFLGVIDGLYKDVIFHGSHHAADCVSTVEWFMHLDSIRLQTHALDHFMSIMSAAIHDVGHPGNNNLFETKTMSALAVRYNDSSILENYHLSLGFETMLKDQESNWFELLPKEHRSGGGDGPGVDMQQYIRRGLIEMVLSTDMARHSDHVQQLKDLLTKEEEEHAQGQKGRRTQGQKQESLEKKLFILKTVLHAADISNPCKPKDIMLGWVDRVLQEFWCQGDQEKKLNLPISPLCDRESGMGIVPKGQCGFIKFVIQPFFQAVVELMPEAEEATDELEKNFAFWTQMDQKGATYEQIFQK